MGYSTTEAAGGTGYRQRLKRLIAGLLVIALLAFAQGPSYNSVANSVNTIRNASWCNDGSLIANTVTCATFVGFVGYVLGQSVDVHLNNTITGAATINVNGLGPKAITYNGSTPMTAAVGAVAGSILRLSYDNFTFVVQGIVNTASGSGGGGPVTFSTLSLVLSGGTTPIYVPIGGGGLGSTTETDVQMRVHAVTTFSNVCTKLSVAPGGGNSLVIQMRDNAANTGITMTISGAAVSACDTTHTFTNAADDLMDFSIVPSGVIALFTPDVNIYGQAGSISAGAVNAGTINQTAFYAAAGSTISGGGPGTAGQCWTSNGVGSPPSFQACGGGGSVSFAQPYATDGVNFFAPIFQSVKPLDTTWINQTTASLVVTNGSKFLDKPNVSGHDDVACRVLAIPGAPTPYTLSLGYTTSMMGGTGGSGGFAAAVDGTGKLVMVGHLLIGGGTQAFATAVFHATAPNVNFAEPFNQSGTITLGPQWLRIKDDGTTLFYYQSPDGINYIQVASESDVAFMAVAIQAGFCLQNEGAAFDAGMTVFHMTLTTP